MKFENEIKKRHQRTSVTAKCMVLLFYNEISDSLKDFILYQD